VLGREAPRLAWELARRTGLLVHAVEPDPAKAAAARAALAAAGVYGVRVLVDGVSPESTNGLPYPTYFANLIVVRDGAPAGVSSKAVLKCLKPCGGVLYAAPAAAPGDGWARAGAAPAGQLAGEAGWVKLVRGPLPGARDWTHQYADAGNSGSSDDEFLRGKPEVLWYGEPGPDKMQDRHLRSEAPLSLDGRVYCQGLRYREGRPLLLCFDAYNGVPYWEREVPGAQRIQIQNDCGNLAVSRAGLFVAVSNRCLRLDLATGATVQTLDAPGAAGRPWAYVAVEGDRLAGSVLSSPQFSDIVFAYDTTTGRLAWRRDGGPVRNSTLAVCGGRLFFVENRAGKKTEAPADPLAAQARAKAAERRGEAPPPEATVRTVVALDLATGRELWARDVDLAGCGGWASSLNLIAKRGVVLLSGTYSAYGKPKGTEDARRAVALSAADGALLWNEPIGNRVRPVVVKDRIVARPRAFDLQTGAPVMKPGSKKPIPWTMVNLGACGQIAASAELLFFRDGVTAITDVKTGMRVMSFIGMRPGCLINIVPAGGVAVQVESSSGCVCAHPLQGTIAFAPLGAE
jgi:outer membrane protein assembly factor BamB